MLNARHAQTPETLRFTILCGAMWPIEGGVVKHPREGAGWTPDGAVF